MDGRWIREKSGAEADFPNVRSEDVIEAGAPLVASVEATVSRVAVAASSCASTGFTEKCVRATATRTTAANLGSARGISTPFHGFLPDAVLAAGSETTSGGGRFNACASRQENRKCLWMVWFAESHGISWRPRPYRSDGELAVLWSLPRAGVGRRRRAVGKALLA